MDLKNPKAQKILIGIVLVCIVSYVYFGCTFFSFCYRARKANIEEMEKEYSKLSAELEKARKIVGKLAQLEAEYERLHDQWMSAQELLPEEKEMPDLLRKVTTAGNKAGVKFALFQPQNPVQQEFFTSHPIKVKVKGGFHQVGIFLSRLANLPRIVNVSGLSLESPRTTGRKGEKGESSETVLAEFTLTAYTLPGGAYEIATTQ
ncbi:MAG: type 4a pilus biogenesis protein PilO [Candidatus Latescibacteria bacterium]|nr:type 4a pilus biogenesis protein PilO [Candidatus Latescibacterota bacterium]NIM20999.1 type 4a pilus biogenesis protein PilO [Candidatus Latescibacterota bacterium]NIM65134.1 type 4a pilus biogenesis protein PilO [Candidatus Latescibacterota bacterium]NIO01649.1 type 4a pilus biogenesis protein PilO [Candidatus Latescibacterota bacterium]NIO28166.1 type 4a pilus biogenesis protein PilO [Candidatus Latescibacterota bacterium]